MKKDEYTVVQDVPFRATLETFTPDLTMVSEKRDYGSDSGYDFNTIDRIKAMAQSCTGKLMDEFKSQIDTKKLPDFASTNKLVVTVQIVKE